MNELCGREAEDRIATEKRIETAYEREQNRCLL